MSKLLHLVIILIWFLPAPLFAIDVGVVLDQNAVYSGTVDFTSFNYKGIVIPRITGLLGGTGDFYISAGFNFMNDPLSLVPELLRTELSGRYGNIDYTIGRMDYEDPLGYIATGLFDGGQLSFDTAVGSFSAGAWYTGLLYKKRTGIEMTENEREANKADIESNNFGATYFAPSRAFAAVDWEHKGLWDRALARLSLLSQFDFTGEKVNSQYLAGKAIIPFGAFSVDFGGCFELIKANDDIGSAFAVESAFAWMSPIHRLSFSAKYASGGSDTLAAFLPLTTNTQGQILKPKLSGIAMLSLDYIARLNEMFSIGLYPAFFILTDSESRGKGMLGGEIFTALYWSPVPDISVNLGAGVYMPSPENAAPDEKTYWRLELNVILSLF